MFVKSLHGLAKMFVKSLHGRAYICNCEWTLCENKDVVSYHIISYHNLLTSFKKTAM